MAMSEAFLPEFDQEMATTRKTLERIPEDKFDWKPHEKSFTLRQLGSHLAQLPHWAVIGLTQDAFDMAPPEGEPVQTPQAESISHLLELFDASTAAARSALAAAEDGTFRESWSLLTGGKPLFTVPKVAVIRTFVLNHLIHHRGQLSVYLRLLDVPVPAIYGPSADESSF